MPWTSRSRIAAGARHEELAIDDDAEEAVGRLTNEEQAEPDRDTDKHDGHDTRMEDEAAGPVGRRLSHETD